MFIFTTKLNKKRAVLCLLLLAAVLLAIILLAGRRDRTESRDTPSASSVGSVEEQVEYLASLGWVVEAQPLDVQEIVIPDEFTGVYAEYSRLQQEQGFDLSKYSGREAVRYTYRVLNHPTCSDPVVADLIICRGKLIAGDIQCTALDGFMSTLEFPAAGAASSAGQTEMAPENSPAAGETPEDGPDGSEETGTTAEADAGGESGAPAEAAAADTDGNLL